MSFWWRLLFLNELENIEEELRIANQMRARQLQAEQRRAVRRAAWERMTLEERREYLNSLGDEDDRD